MKTVLYGLCVAVAAALAVGAQAPAPADQDRAAVRQAAYDYGEGFYEGAAERMERAVHPAIIKRGVVSAPDEGSMLTPMNAETLVEITRRGREKQPPDKRNISFALLDIRDNVATAKIFTVQFNDYLHLVKQDGRWRIAHVLWQPPSPTGVANGEADKAAVARVLEDFVGGLAANDPARVEPLTHPEAALRQFRLAPPPGKPFIVEGNRDTIVSALRAKQMPPLASPDAKVLDVYDNIASAAMTTPNGIVAYVHLARQNHQWRVVNMLLNAPASAMQVSRPQPGTVEHPMPDFSLPALDGRTVTLSQLKGKNVLLVFPRGRYTDQEWCVLCHYQYAELAELEQVQQFRSKYNVEVLFVLPFDKATVGKWVAAFPESMAEVDTMRNSSPAMRERLPKPVTFKPGPGATPFPILYDADQSVSTRLGLFSRRWDGTTTDQNVPTVFVIDKAGVIRFKHTSQNTFDRPSAGYLVQVLAKMVN